MSAFLTYILAGLLTVVAGEFEVNVLVLRKGPGAFFGALFLYVLALTLMYMVGKFIEARASAKNADAVAYLIGGAFGLSVEWFLIGNAPWAGNGAIQAGMFAWWGATFLIPRVFIAAADATVRTVRRQIVMSLASYSILSVTAVSLAPQNARAAITALLLSVGFIFINFQCMPYLVRNGFSRVAARIFMWSLAVSAVVGVFF